ncbi:unnamed protein product [Pieris macdunnoughi]|uniref:rRNA-processing protein UTP23 homolog n=1 Tax=Pieris macdunnoughi TaxID=345717 RepID=A0A821R6L5_9NEOP|nr:unnamed protein product [Pieris macdunnoughi]
MKLARYKKAQKYLKFYYNNYGFRQPYQVMMDGTFCFAAFQQHINIRDQLPKYLDGNIKFLTTRCIIVETEKVAKKTQGALAIIKQFGIHECGHKEPKSGTECILSMIADVNDKHYIVATQDRDLQERLKRMPGVPLIYLHNKSPTLLKPSSESYSKAYQLYSGDSSRLISVSQTEALEKMKRTLGIESTPEEKKIVAKKPHNPNPLSCKKKKRKNDVKQNVKDGKVRKRKKNKQQVVMRTKS